MPRPLLDGDDAQATGPDAGCLAAAAAASGYDYRVVGQAIAEQVMGFAVRDGWNDLGDVGRDGNPCTGNCRPYSDYTGYVPSGGATGWSPGLEDFGDGYFFRQEHVTPQIGLEAALRVITPTDRTSRVAPAPAYDYALENQLVIGRLANATDYTKTEIELFDRKLDVILTVFGTLAGTGGFPSFEVALNFLVGYTTTERVRRARHPTTESRRTPAAATWTTPPSSRGDAAAGGSFLR